MCLCTRLWLLLKIDNEFAISFFVVLFYNNFVVKKTKKKTRKYTITTTTNSLYDQLFCFE